jgi:hypothetical protein
LYLGACRFKSRTYVERFTFPSFGDGQSSDKLLRLLKHLCKFGQPPGALGG